MCVYMKEVNVALAFRYANLPTFAIIRVTKILNFRFVYIILKLCFGCVFFNELLQSAIHGLFIFYGIGCL